MEQEWKKIVEENDEKWIDMCGSQLTSYKNQARTMSFLARATEAKKRYIHHSKYIFCKDIFTLDLLPHVVSRDGGVSVKTGSIVNQGWGTMIVGRRAGACILSGKQRNPLISPVALCFWLVFFAPGVL